MPGDMIQTDPRQGEIVIYQAEDGVTKVECRFVDETVWLTQQQMAELLNQTLRAYQYCESGQHVPEFANLITLADFFDVSLDYLTGRSETRTRQP